MNKLSLNHSGVTVRDYVAFAAKELGAPVDETLRISDIVFPYYWENIYYLIDYFYSLFGIEILQLNNYTVTTNWSHSHALGVAPGDANRFLIFNNKQDNSWRNSFQDLPLELKGLIRNLRTSNYTVTKTEFGNDEIWYFLYWCYLNYQVSPYGREFFSLVNPFWETLQKDFLGCSINDNLTVRAGSAVPGWFPVAAEMSETIAYEVESLIMGDSMYYTDYSSYYDQDWVINLDDSRISDEEYFATYNFTRKQAHYNIYFGWIPNSPMSVQVVNKVTVCTNCGNESGCTMYLSEYGDFWGESAGIVQCGFCSHDLKLEIEETLERKRFETTTLMGCCPAKILAGYLDQGLTPELVQSVVAARMLDEEFVSTFPEALRLVKEKFNLEPSIVKAFAIKTLRENVCIKRKYFYNCKHIEKRKALYWAGLLNMEMGQSIQTLGGQRVSQLTSKFL